MTLEDLKEYKEPTQLNGTDYYRLPINKIQHLITQAYERGKAELVDEILKLVNTMDDVEVMHDELLGEIRKKALSTNNPNSV